jgi:hypothetical protein
MVTDAIDLSTAVVHSSPADIAAWPITTQIERLTMRPGQDHGLSFQFAANQTWPDYTPPGWDGPIQYTVWAGVEIAGRWHLAGFIQMWRTRPSTGAPILAQWRDWAYDENRWGPMVRHRPQANEKMLFLLSAGNARRGSAGPEGNVTSVRERSNAVLVALPAADHGDFVFGLPGGGESTSGTNPLPSPLVTEQQIAATAQLDAVLAELRKVGGQLQQLTDAVKALKAP